MSADDRRSSGLASRALILGMTGLGLVGTGALAGLQTYRLGQLNRQIVVRQQRLAELEAKNQELTRALDELQSTRKDLEDRLSTLRGQLTSSSTDLDSSRKSFEELQLRYNQVVEERDQLQGKLADIAGERDQAQRSVESLKQASEESNRVVTRLRERLSLVERDYREVSRKLAALEAEPHPGVEVVNAKVFDASPVDPLVARAFLPRSDALSTGAASSPVAEQARGGRLRSNSDDQAVEKSRKHDGESDADSAAASEPFELPPVVVQHQSGVDRAKKPVQVHGRLLQVNESERFIVLDKGSQDGVRLGMVFNLMRGTVVIGRATVVRIRPQLSACTILRTDARGPAQVGDLAVQSGS